MLCRASIYFFVTKNLKGTEVRAGEVRGDTVSILISLREVGDIAATALRSVVSRISVEAESLICKKAEHGSGSPLPPLSLEPEANARREGNSKYILTKARKREARKIDASFDAFFERGTKRRKFASCADFFTILASRDLAPQLTQGRFHRMVDAFLSA